MSKLTPMRAIRAKCLDCCCGSYLEVKECTATTCPLYPYKSGHKPKEGTQEYNFITKGTLSQNTPPSPTLNAKETQIKEKPLQQPTTATQEPNRNLSERISKL